MNGSNLEIRNEFREGRGDRFRGNRHYAFYSTGRLHRQRRNAGDSEAFMGSYGLDVGGDSRSRGGVKTSDRQHNRWGRSHHGHSKPKPRERELLFWLRRASWFEPE